MKKMTELKKFFMIIRIKNNENIEKMSKRLKISASYLSMIESGVRKAKGNFIQTFLNEYKLNKKEQAEFEKAILDTDLEISFNLKELNDSQKKLALMFAEKVKKMSPEILKQITEIIEKF